jgi:hypothetical protein
VGSSSVRARGWASGRADDGLTALILRDTPGGVGYPWELAAAAALRNPGPAIHAAHEPLAPRPSPCPPPIQVGLSQVAAARGAGPQRAVRPAARGLVFLGSWTGAAGGQLLAA